MKTIPVSFYAKTESGYKYAGWKRVSEQNQLELLSWLKSGNRLYFKRYRMQIEDLNRTLKLSNIWKWLAASN